MSKLKNKITKVPQTNFWNKLNTRKITDQFSYQEVLNKLRISLFNYPTNWTKLV